MKFLRTFLAVYIVAGQLGQSWDGLGLVRSEDGKQWRRRDWIFDDAFHFPLSGEMVA